MKDRLFEILGRPRQFLQDGETLTLEKGDNCVMLSSSGDLRLEIHDVVMVVSNSSSDSKLETHDVVADVIHPIKILPKYFKDVESGKKTFEIRYDDRGYKEGDILVMHEWLGFENKYTGNVIEKRICYIIDNPMFLKEGYVVLGMEEI